MIDPSIPVPANAPPAAAPTSETVGHLWPNDWGTRARHAEEPSLGGHGGAASAAREHEGRKGTRACAATYPDVEALLPVVGQRDVGVELDGDALAVVAALGAAAPAAAASPAPAAPAAEGAVAQRGGDHLDVGRSSHQGQGSGGAPRPAWWWWVEKKCARGERREEGGAKGKEERGCFSLRWCCGCVWGRATLPPLRAARAAPL